MNASHFSAPGFRNAFSLLELVVVISVIVILLGIMVPAMYHFIQYVRHLGH
jgi:prepilin-type N-terminal cleavage/methylation domain-containing protein